MKLKRILFTLIIVLFSAFISCEKDDDLVQSEAELQILNNTYRKYAALVDSDLTKNVDSQTSCSFKVVQGTHRLECFCEDGPVLDTMLYIPPGVAKIVEFKTDESGNCNVFIYDYMIEAPKKEPDEKHPLE